MRRFILSIVFAVVALAAIAPSLARAQTPDNLIPEFNPLCWKKKDCVEARRAFNRNATDQELNDGWVPDQRSCPGEGWGKCLPGGQTVTAISFGGERRFTDVGVFITQMYKFAIGLAGIVAVIVIIVSGIQWAVSGGSSEIISGAKTRIGGALIGLFIAYMSYVILNTINPNLVNFRLPSVWMLKPQAIMPKFCSQASDEVKNKPSFALAMGTDQQLEPVSVPPSDIKYELTFKNDKPEDKNERNFYCGKRFYLQNAGKNTCWGDYCDTVGSKNTSCIYDAGTNTYGCKEGNFFINITHNSLLKQLFPDAITREWNDPPVNSVYALHVACVGASYFSGSIGSIGGGDNSHRAETWDVKPDVLKDGKSQNIALSVSPESLDRVVKGCQDNGGQMKGFVLSFEMNQSYNTSNQRHYIGVNGEDLGDVDFFADHWEDIPDSYFFKADDIRKGITLNIEAAAIKDINQLFGKSNAKDQSTYFSKFGLTPN